MINCSGNFTLTVISKTTARWECAFQPDSWNRQAFFRKSGTIQLKRKEWGILQQIPQLSWQIGVRHVNRSETDALLLISDQQKCDSEQSFSFHLVLIFFLPGLLFLEKFPRTSKEFTQDFWKNAYNLSPTSVMLQREHGIQQSTDTSAATGTRPRILLSSFTYFIHIFFSWLRKSTIFFSFKSFITIEGTLIRQIFRLFVFLSMNLPDKSIPTVSKRFQFKIQALWLDNNSWHSLNQQMCRTLWYLCWRTTKTPNIEIEEQNTMDYRSREKKIDNVRNAH